ncbi:phosphoglucosamine mutase [Brevifollis gellanilyticus]|uniref:Phosphoglucosamine mutase n=1 Tax=Brevifollis gellanilyticus TaxID=748831 RepID=A0A512M622_9BACT|nr:phosphoglucosamine mutase [Brevifollis gellanilyticus]GEP42180.1 phosphoglucosamine mutase [Brevifollis gellanilyticus]
MSEKRQFFGTDGVRAVANRHPMTPEFVMRLGQAAAVVLGKKPDVGERPRCIIGRDTRASGEMFEAALIAGLNSAGVDVVLAGMVPTPAVAMLADKTGADFGIVVSASHNPFHDNGIKFVHGNGRKLSDKTEIAIEKIVLGTSDEAPRLEGRGIGRVSRMKEAVDLYVAHAVASMGGVRLDGMRVALDNAHGAASYTSAAALEKLGADVQVFHSEPDGFNINEECGCTHSDELERLVRQSQAQAGIAHDGDADRIALCDEEAIALDGDELMAIAAESMLRKGTLKQNTVAVTIMSNYGLDDLVSRLGGRVIRTNVGDRYVLEEMHARGLNFGGEQSGHIIFGDWATTGDGLVAGLQVLKIMKETGEPLSQLRKCLKKFPQAARNLRVRSKPPADDLKEAQKIIKETEKKLGDYGRVLLRYSGTEPLIRLLIEGRDVEYLEAQADKIASAILAQIG